MTNLILKTIKSWILLLRCKIKRHHVMRQMFTKRPTMIELELKSSLFSRASGHEKQTAR